MLEAEEEDEELVRQVEVERWVPLERWVEVERWVPVFGVGREGEVMLAVLVLLGMVGCVSGGWYVVGEWCVSFSSQK